MSEQGPFQVTQDPLGSSPGSLRGVGTGGPPLCRFLPYPASSAGRGLAALRMASPFSFLPEPPRRPSLWDVEPSHLLCDGPKPHGQPSHPLSQGGDLRPRGSREGAGGCRQLWGGRPVGQRPSTTREPLPQLRSRGYRLPLLRPRQATHHSLKGQERAQASDREGLLRQSDDRTPAWPGQGRRRAEDGAGRASRGRPCSQGGGQRG